MNRWIISQTSRRPESWSRFLKSICGYAAAEIYRLMSRKVASNPDGPAGPEIKKGQTIVVNTTDKPKPDTKPSCCK